MASKKDEKKSPEAPGMKKRTTPKGKEEQKDSPKEEGVVRAPEAPTTAPNAPAKSDGKAPVGGRRVVDPKKAEAEAKKRAEAEKKARKKALRSKPKKSDKGVGSEDPGFRFGDADATMDDFAAMLEGEAGAVPDRRRFDLGDTVEGEVVTVGERYIFVDIGRPDEAIVERGQFEDEEGNLELEVGQRREFYVVGFSDGIELGKELGESDNSMEAVEAAFASGAPISGTVKGTNKGGFEVNVAGVDAFCPISQIELGYTEEPDIHVGNTYTFEVSEIKDDGRTVVVSRTALLERQRQAQREETLERLKVGAEVEGVVTRVAEFGAFVDIGGVEGLVHVSELSHVYHESPTEVGSEGDTVTVQIMNIDEGDKRSDSLRIGLSMKATQDDPWMVVNEKFAVGENIVGTVVRLTTFGAFVEILPGVEGLVHVSEMSRTRHVATPDQVVEVGEEVQVEIQDIDVMRRRISLSMAAAEDDPWKEVNDRFRVGMEVEGTVANIEDFGAFIDLGKGITALLPRSEMNLPSETTPHRKFSNGEAITTRVLNIEPERRRMALTLRDAAEIDHGDKSKKASKSAGGSRSYSDPGTSKKGSLGTLGDLLKARQKDAD